MTDRAQFTTHNFVRWIVTAGVALFVHALVVDEALSAPALAAGELKQVCGLCHVDWRRQATALAIITGLVLVAGWLLGGPKWPPEEDSDE